MCAWKGSKPGRQSQGKSGSASLQGPGTPGPGDMGYVTVLKDTDQMKTVLNERVEFLEVVAVPSQFARTPVRSSDAALDCVGSNYVAHELFFCEAVKAPFFLSLGNCKIWRIRMVG